MLQAIWTQQQIKNYIKAMTRDGIQFQQCCSHLVKTKAIFTHSLNQMSSNSMLKI